MGTVFAIFLLSNTLIQNLRNTGAFEVFYNGTLPMLCTGWASQPDEVTGMPAWSKLAENRLPNWEELIHGLELAGLETSR